MKPSHLISLALLSVAGSAFGHSPAPMQFVIGDQFKRTNPGLDWATQAILDMQLSRVPSRGCPPPMSWDRLNQRQVRKNRRRAHAAGCKKAFHQPR